MKNQLIIINFIVAILIAIITAKLSIYGFYRQEVWLRKERKYSQIIDHLSLLQKYYGDVFEQWTGLSEEINNNDLINKEYNKSRRELELATFSQGFIIKKEVSEILMELFESAAKETSDERMGNIVSYFDRMYGEVKEAKIRIIEIANEDLRIK